MTAIDPNIRSEIDRKLDEVTETEKVRILMAIESGSRAWGFPSPDSDYDVRFIYTRNADDYLSLHPVRDVIELPIEGDLDISGWDIRKALNLLLKNNAVVAEWLDSAIRYVPTDPAMAEMAELADRHFNPKGYARHYSSLGRNNLERWNLSADGIPVKRYFYSLRPALSIRALRLNPGARPPMRLQDLVQVSDLSTDLVFEIERLVELKSRTREAGMTTRSSAIEHLIVDELDRADEIEERVTDRGFVDEANALFRSIVFG